MSPKAMGVHSDWGFSCNTQCDWERPMESGQVWSGLTSIGVIGGYDEVADHMHAM